MPRSKSIGEQLKAVREAADISQFELARRTGLSQHQISAIEDGCEVPWEDAVKLIEACGGKVTIRKP